jgi:hypothetical protein
VNEGTQAEDLNGHLPKQNKRTEQSCGVQFGVQEVRGTASYVVSDIRCFREGTQLSEKNLTSLTVTTVLLNFKPVCVDTG